MSYDVEVTVKSQKGRHSTAWLTDAQRRWK